MDSSPVYVLGAGIVGISCALELQRRGHSVVLIDRRAPGEETSAGNAGVLSYSNITPLASPALVRRSPRLLLNRDLDFRLHYSHLPALMPWLMRFLLRCRRSVYLRDGESMNILTRASIALHRQWIEQAGAGELVNPNRGGLKLYREKRGFERDALERELLQRSGVGCRLLECDEIRELEPDLAPVFRYGVLIEDTVSLRDPRELCRAYARYFGTLGGTFERAEVRALRPRGDAWELVTERENVAAGRVVVCLGAWTPPLLAPLGYANPLAIERGYHMMLAPAADATLGRPVFDVDSSYVMVPMAGGLRVSSGTNLVYREAPPDPRQLFGIMPRVREAFPVAGELLEQPWMGRRPTVPDTLPVIGPAPRHDKLWFAFAHGHMGLTLGPVSGVMIADFIDGREQAAGRAACSPSRWL